ncbi:MAG: DUF3592 domain-containing protein [Verrucomicrobiaceae bacterium]|nr:DUF3592 domain-containing protein [Verrucomicrobiaceae bacterium]
MNASDSAQPQSSRKPDPRWKFFAIFVLVGLLGLIPFTLQAVRDYRIARVYELAECEIVSHRMVENTTIYRWGGGRETEERSQHPEFTFKFRAGGREHVTTGLDNHDGVTTLFELWRIFDDGGKYPCWYDPDDPEKAVLLRRFEWKFYLGALIPGFFILVCGNLMRRALAGSHDYGKGAKCRGSRLRYRLVPVLSHRQLTGCLLLVIIVLAVALVGIWAAPWHAHTTQMLSPMFYVFGIGLAAEVFLAWHFIRAVKVAGIAEPEVEIDDEPLVPGQGTALSVLQPGPLRVRRYEVLLVCDEASSDASTPVKIMLIEQDDVEIRDAAAANARIFTATFTVPAAAKPSTRELQLIRTWGIRVRRQLDARTTLETDFPFRVREKDDDKHDGPCAD